MWYCLVIWNYLQIKSFEWCTVLQTCPVSRLFLILRWNVCPPRIFPQICSRISRGKTLNIEDWKNESYLLMDAASGDGGLVSDCRPSKSMRLSGMLRRGWYFWEALQDVGSLKRRVTSHLEKIFDRVICGSCRGTESKENQQSAADVDVDADADAVASRSRSL